MVEAYLLFFGLICAKTWLMQWQWHSWEEHHSDFLRENSGRTPQLTGTCEWVARPRPWQALAFQQTTQWFYCRALVIGIPQQGHPEKLRRIRNSAARILMRVRKHKHITPVLNPSNPWLQHDLSRSANSYSLHPPKFRPSAPPPLACRMPSLTMWGFHCLWNGKWLFICLL